MNSVVCLLFVFYFAIVLGLSCFTNYALALLASACFFTVAIVIWNKKLKDVEFSVPIIQAKQPGRKWLPAICFGIIFVFSALYWLAYYPGGFNLDAYGQWEQARGMLPFDDWHPVFSTLLIKLATLIINQFSFYIFIQILVFSLSMAALFSVLQAYYVHDKLIVAAAVLIGISPAIGLNTISMTKDVQFTILIVNLSACYLRIIHSGEEWLKKPHNMILLGLLSGMAALVRHNGFLFVLPAFAALALGHKRYLLRVLVSALISVVFFFGIRGAAYRYLEVIPHENVIGESVGIPMSILANSMVADADNFPEDAHSFLNEIASDAEWRYHYNPGEWDSCKWIFGGTELLKDTSLSEILHYTAETIIRCPQASYESFRLNTKIVWHPIITDPYWIPDVFVEDNDAGIVSHPVTALLHVAEIGKTVSLLPLISAATWNTGFHILVMMLAFCARHKTIQTRKLLLILPFLIYDGGTMLLLSGPNQRYFYCNAVLFLPITFALLSQESESGAI